MGLHHESNGLINMKLIDLHADTITAMYYDNTNWQVEQEFILDKPILNLDKNNLHIDLDKLKQADSLAQFFVCWLNLKACEKYNITAWDLFVKQYNALQNELNKYPEQIQFVRSIEEMNKAHQNNKISAFTCIEEGACIDHIDKLVIAKQMGVKYITIVWNYESHIAVPAAVNQDIGLKKFGFDMVEEMQNLDILVDVSHLSDKGVRDVLSIAKKPIIASHSNARALCSHRRNLTDELIPQIANNGGVIGVNCYPSFLDDNEPIIKINNMVRHIRHIYNLAGENTIAIGNDFDGFHSKKPELDEIKHIGDMPKLAEALLNDGFTHQQVEKFFSKNILRILN